MSDIPPPDSLANIRQRHRMMPSRGGSADIEWLLAKIDTLANQLTNPLTIVHAAPHIQGRTCERQPDGTWKPIKWEQNWPVKPGSACISTHDVPLDS